MTRGRIAALAIALLALALAFVGAAVAGATHERALGRFSVNVARVAGLASAWTGWRLYQQRRRRS